MNRQNINSIFWPAGALMGTASIVLGAIGAHALEKRNPNPNSLANWKTATQYLMFNAIALLAISRIFGGRMKNIAGTLIMIGALLFSGTIYLHNWCPSNKTIAHFIKLTPTGGTMQIIGWFLLAFA